jgi:hypothetical protein
MKMENGATFGAVTVWMEPKKMSKKLKSPSLFSSSLS